jgi:hypothetical protein
MPLCFESEDKRNRKLGLWMFFWGGVEELIGVGVGMDNVEIWLQSK